MAIRNEVMMIGTIEVLHTWSSDGHKIRKVGSTDEVKEAVDVANLSQTGARYPTYEEVGAFTDAQAQDAAKVVTEIFGGPITAQRGAAIRDAIIASQTDEQAAATPELYPVWSASDKYSAGDRRRYDGVLYKCLQAHTGQSDWTPAAAPSLWAKVLVETDESGQQTTIKEWEQPDSTNPYSKGDKVTYKGKTYESSIDNNVWSPETNPTGWTEVAA